MSRFFVLRCAFLWLCLTTAAFADTWKLKEIKSFATDAGVSVVDQHLDRQGGYVEVDVAGEAASLCAEGTERIRFEWQFDRDIGSVETGEKLSARLQMRQAAATPPCNDAIFKRASLTLAGSDGWSTPEFDAATSALIDGGMFTPSTAIRIFGADVSDEAGSTGSLRIGPYAHAPDRPLAYFLLVAETAGGIVEVTYVYDSRLTEAVSPPVSP